MCGRFTLKTDIKTIAEVFGVVPSLEISPRYNVAPTQEVVTILNSSPGNANTSSPQVPHLAQLRWGLIPAWAKEEAIGNRMINARAETLAEKPSFKGLLRSKRCLIVADGFYEWKQENGSKTPMYITLKDGMPFALAGLWDLWKSPDGRQIQSCTIITTEPNALVASIHNRMPVILPTDSQKLWLDSMLTDVDALLPLLTAYPPEAMAARAVSRLVNDPKRDSPELIA